MMLYRDGTTRVSTSCDSAGFCNGWTRDDGRAANPASITYTYAALGRILWGSGRYYFDGALRGARLYDLSLIHI